MAVFVNDTFMVGKRKSRKTKDKIVQIFYKGCCESNTSYFNVLAYELREGCW